MLMPAPGEGELAWWQSFGQFCDGPKPRSFVYVLQAEGDSAVKVGVAKDVRARVATLQTGNSRKLVARALLFGGHDLETAIHREMAGFRVVGEWFDSSSGMDWFLERMQTLGQEMLRIYRTEDRIPDFREFPPYDQLEKREEAAWHGRRQRSRARATRPTRLSG